MFAVWESDMESKKLISTLNVPMWIIVITLGGE